MSWTYENGTGNLYTPECIRYASGYAGGNCGRNLEGVNNSSMQDVQCVGPLPHGPKADGITPNGFTFGTPVDSAKLGPFAIPLIPDSDNAMYDRGDFFCHGDTSAMNHSASEGCMIFSRTVREALAMSDDKHINVVATFGG